MAHLYVIVTWNIILLFNNPVSQQLNNTFLQGKICMISTTNKGCFYLAHEACALWL